MFYTLDQIKTFFGYLESMGLTCDFSMGNINVPQDFERIVREYFGASIARLILDTEALKDIPLLVNGTDWEQAIAKWRLSLS